MHVTIMTFVGISLSLRPFIPLIATALFSNKDQHLSEHYAHAVLTSYTNQIEIAIAWHHLPSYSIVAGCAITVYESWLALFILLMWLQMTISIRYIYPHRHPGRENTVL